MHTFINLYEGLKKKASTHEHTLLLHQYLTKAPEEDRLHALALLSGRKYKRICSINQLKTWMLEITQTPQWLFEECQEVVGEVAETIQLIIPNPRSDAERSFSLTACMSQLDDLRGLTTEQKKETIGQIWSQLESEERRLFNKLLTNTLRLKPDFSIINQGISLFTELDPYRIACRLQQDWSPETHSFHEVFQTNPSENQKIGPVEFCEPIIIRGNIQELGNPLDWLAEWCWSGQRCQLIKDEAGITLWSCENQLIPHDFSKLNALCKGVTDTFIIDGIFIHTQDKKAVLPGPTDTRSHTDKETEDTFKGPIFCAVDILIWNGENLKEEPQESRSKMLEAKVKSLYNDNDVLVLSDEISFDSWAYLAEIRKTPPAKYVTGIMLKHRQRPYKQQLASWVIWPSNAFQLRGILLYAHRGTGFGSGGFESFTLGVQVDREEYIPIVKLPIDLSEEDQENLTQYIRDHTIERFGPVLSVHPALIFEVTFQSLQRSNRRKSGLLIQKVSSIKWLHAATPEDVTYLCKLMAFVEGEL